jgi:hypothetical protein
MIADIDYGDVYRSVSGYRFSDTVSGNASIAAGITFLSGIAEAMP